MSNLIRFDVESHDGKPAVCIEAGKGYWTPWYIAERRTNDLRQELTAARDEAERLRARVAELEGEVDRARRRIAKHQDDLKQICCCVWGGDSSFDVGQAASWMQDRAESSLSYVVDIESWLLRKQAEAVEAIRPTTEMKAEMLGAFKFTEEMTCSACHFDEPDNDCEVCGGDVTYAQDFQIPWTSQKQIIGTAVAHVAQRLRQQANEAEKAGGES